VLPGKTYSVDEVTQILRTRWWLVVLPFVIGSIGGVFLYTRTPERYRSETMIMVVPQRVPDAYVKPTVVGTVEDRLSSINDQILSRSRLERIITDFNLYPEARAAGGIMQDIVEQMREDIEVDPPADGQSTFRVGFSASDPATARKVTERLASLYIEENLRDRESLAENTSLFLESQLEDARRRLKEQEAKLEVYKNRHANTLPEQVAGNLQAISGFQIQLKEVNGSINHARERRLLLERQLADVESLPLSAPLPNMPADATARQSAAQQLEMAKVQLEAMKQRYKPEHPDIKTGERLIRDLQAKADEEAKQAKLNPTKASPAELARQRSIRDLKDQIADIDRQISAANIEASALRARINEYQIRIDVVPAREAELVELTRDYETLRQTYTSLLSKKEDSKLAANLERGQIGEQFRILDPASLPQRPYNQMRRVTMGVGASLAGLFLGLLIVGGLEFRDSSFKTEEDVLRVLSLPVLALVPVMGPAPDARQPRKKWRSALGLSAFFLVVACAAALVVWNQ
jgi:polysaccharide chain length determinant protein (PEP-CTERM system associated)